MATFDLDRNEELDTMTINGVQYVVGDIPLRILEKVMKIKAGFFRRATTEQWKPILQEILEIRNKNVDISNITDAKILAFVEYLKTKITKGQIG